MEIYNQKQQRIGELKDGTYHIFKKPEHFMRIYQGFGISDSVLKTLNDSGCINVRITYLGAKKVSVYLCPLSCWLESKKTFTFDYEDLQRFVSVKDMETINIKWKLKEER